MQNFIQVMKALGDPNRVKIVKMLQERPLCVCEIVAALEIAQSRVSKHLKVLEEAGMVYSVKDGLWVNYYVTDGRNSPYIAVLLGNLRHWLNEDAEIADLMVRLPGIDRQNVCQK